MESTAAISPEELENLRYPIGKYDRTKPISETSLKEAIHAISCLPSEVRAAVFTLSDVQLDTPYRPGGWTLRQTVHHLADSHMNSYIRIKLALTEENPTIKPYDEKCWADLPDSQTADVDLSLNLLDALHERWVVCLEILTPEQWKRSFNHPESGLTTIEMAAPLYAWHGKHHLTQIKNLRERMEW